MIPNLSATRLVLLLAAVAVVYFLVTGAMQAVQSYQLGQEAEQLEEELRQVEERYRRLEALRNYLNSDEYIEAVAREQLGLVRPGEMSIVVISTSSPPTPGEEEEPTPELWWEALIGQ